MVLDVITYPDKRLFEKSVDVVKFDDELAKFLDDMYDTMI
ncbi:peptide deformylase, partial [Campylobacter fetus]